MHSSIIAVISISIISKYNREASLNTTKADTISEMKRESIFQLFSSPEKITRYVERRLDHKIQSGSTLLVSHQPFWTFPRKTHIRNKKQIYKLNGARLWSEWPAAVFCVLLLICILFHLWFAAQPELQSFRIAAILAEHQTGDEVNFVINGSNIVPCSMESL